jgi:hypothetical protein
VISIRWFVVAGDPPLSCRPSSVAHAQPPGPGLPEQAPSVQTSSAPSAAGIAAGTVRRADDVAALASGNVSGAHVRCAQRRPTLSISCPGRIGPEQTSHVAGYFAVSATPPP